MLERTCMYTLPMYQCRMLPSTLQPANLMQAQVGNSLFFSFQSAQHPRLETLKRFIYSGVVLIALTYQLIWNKKVKTYKVIFYVNVTQTNCELCHIFHCFNESVRHTRGFLRTQSCIMGEHQSTVAVLGRSLI